MGKVKNCAKLGKVLYESLVIAGAGATLLGIGISILYAKATKKDEVMWKKRIALKKVEDLEQETNDLRKALMQSVTTTNVIKQQYAELYSAYAKEYGSNEGVIEKFSTLPEDDKLVVDMANLAQEKIEYQANSCEFASVCEDDCFNCTMKDREDCASTLLRRLWK